MIKQNAHLIAIALLTLVVGFQAYKIHNIEKLAKMTQKSSVAQGELLNYLVTVDPQLGVNGFTREVYNSLQQLQKLGK